MVGDSSISIANGPNVGKLVNSYDVCAAQTVTRRTVPFESVNPYNNSQRARANAFWVWNPTDNFSMGTWASLSVR